MGDTDRGFVTPEMLARWFHQEYERMAPTFDYQTRESSAVPWEDVPEPNRRLMQAVSASVLLHFFPDRMAVPFAAEEGGGRAGLRLSDPPPSGLGSGHPPTTVGPGYGGA